MEGRDNCDMNAVCSDSVGSFTCDCVDGFIGNGTTCAGIQSPHHYIVTVTNKMWRINLTRINSSHTALTTCAAHEPTSHSLHSLWVFRLKHIQYTHWAPATSTKLLNTYNSRCNDLPKFGINYAVKQSTCMQQWILLWGSMTMFRSSIFGWSIA